MEGAIAFFLNGLPRSGDYDCVVALSGGKDSSFTLKRLVEVYRMRCLAVLVDNGFISEQALKNCHYMCAGLDVDLQIFKPSPVFMEGMYRESVRAKSLHVTSAVKRASDICNSCINLINNHMVKTAVQVGAPVVAGGYIGGQVPRNSAVLDFSLLKLNTANRAQRERYIQALGPQSTRYFSVPNITTQDNIRISIINPMLALSLAEDAIVADLEAFGWRKSLDTGRNSSNCLLNDLGVLLHRTKYGFHPYMFEVAEQVRAGLVSRQEAIEKVEETLHLEDFSKQIQKLGLSHEDFRVF